MPQSVRHTFDTHLTACRHLAALPTPLACKGWLIQELLLLYRCCQAGRVQGHAQGHVQTTGVLCDGINRFGQSMQPLTDFSSLVAAVDKPSGVCGGQRVRSDYDLHRVPTKR